MKILKMISYVCLITGFSLLVQYNAINSMNKGENNLFDIAVKAYESKDYKTAVDKFNQYIEMKMPTFAQAIKGFLTRNESADQSIKSFKDSFLNNKDVGFAVLDALKYLQEIYKKGGGGIESDSILERNYALLRHNLSD